MRATRWTGRSVAALATVAAGLTALQLTRPGLFLGSTPDVSVYLGSAVRLAHGVLPYRDYIYVQPPGFTLLTAPIGLLSEAIGTRDALGALRLLTPLLAGANVLLVGRLVRHRGLAATLVACTVMACFPAELYAIRGPQLEPVVDLLLLLGVVLVFDGDDPTSRRRRLIAGGVVLGLAVAVKLSAAMPLAVVLLVCARAVRQRSIPVAAGVAGGFALLTVPLAAFAPASFWQDAVVTQLDRLPDAGRATLSTRLGDMTGLAEIHGPPAVVIAVSVLLVVAVAAAFAASRRRLTPLEWFAVGGAAAVALAQLLPAQYYTQYAALLAPFVSLALGLAVARGAEMLPCPRTVFATVGVACAALVISQVFFVLTESAPDPAATVDAAVPAGACALSDSPVLLFTADRFRSTVVGCTQMTDPGGTVLALAGDTEQSVDTWRLAFAHVDYVVTNRPIARWGIPAAAGIPKYVTLHFRLVRANRLLVYVRSV